MSKCTKPNCNCIEIAEAKNGGQPVKEYPCLAGNDADELKTTKPHDGIATGGGISLAYSHELQRKDIIEKEALYDIMNFPPHAKVKKLTGDARTMFINVCEALNRYKFHSLPAFDCLPNGITACGKSTVDGSYVKGVYKKETGANYINDIPVHSWSVGVIPEKGIVSPPRGPNIECS